VAKGTKRGTKRGQGRPDPSAAVGKQSVITAVRKALMTTPPGEITFHQVAGLAGVDQRLIRYYFGTLPELLSIVAMEVTKELRARIVASNAKAGSPRDHIRMRVEIFLNTFGSNPHYHRLVVDYLYEPDEPEHGLALGGLRDSIDELKELLRSVGSRRETGPADARLVHVSMAALCEFLFSAMPVFVELFGEDARSPAFRKRYCEFVTDLMIGAAN
jgi:AcrR family transcriptional regulator